MLHARKGGESIAQGAVERLRSLWIKTAETPVDFEEQIVFDVQSGVEMRGVVCAANEESSSSQERERESNLDHDQRIAR